MNIWRAHFIFRHLLPMTNSPREATPLNAPPPPAARKLLFPRVFVGVGVALVLLIGVVVVNTESSTHVHIRSTTSLPNALSFPGSSDLITTLPGMPSTYTSRLFSGYLLIPNGGEGFYFLAESQSTTPEKDPVLLWLNGGPGASSLGGCFSENGPLLVNDDGTTLRVNDFGWNKNANMVCIESPIGVGFTYNASGIYRSDDIAQADDLYWMLQAFFGKFPWLRQNDFIITGESYGGIYVPMTAKRIVEGNQQADASLKINLKKFAVGNGINEFMSLSQIAFAYYHGLIGTEAYMAVGVACPALLTPGTYHPEEVSEVCGNAIETAFEQMEGTNINSYNVLAKCDGGDPMAGFQQLIDKLNGPPQLVPRPIGLSLSLCRGLSVVKTYFNLRDVRTAFHTKPEVPTWNDKSLTSTNLDLGTVLNKTKELVPIIQNKVLQYDANLQMPVTHLWTFLMNHDVQGVIYHGDIDITCDFIGGLWGVESLQLPRKQPRAAWSVPGDDQVAGFAEDFGTIKYVTVKGAGHMVPTDKPREAKAMLDLFVLVK